jgi:hypothetical protein
MIVIESQTPQLEYALESTPKGSHVPLYLLRPSSTFDDECCSLASTSYSSSSSFFSEDETRRVTFSEDNEVHLVERIYLQENLNEHFYSHEDTQTFRRESRLERKLLAEVGANESSHEGELQDLFQNNNDLSNNKHEISRVIILHNDKLKTFCDPRKQYRENTNDFFDNDSFWSGSMTWH